MEARIKAREAKSGHLEGEHVERVRKVSVRSTNVFYNIFHGLANENLHSDNILHSNYASLLVLFVLSNSINFRIGLL